MILNPILLLHGKLLVEDSPVGAYGASKEIMSSISPKVILSSWYFKWKSSGDDSGIAQLTECLKPGRMKN